MAQLKRESDQEYLGFEIEARVGNGINGWDCHVRVTGPDGSVISFSESVDVMYAYDGKSEVPKEDDELALWLDGRSVGRARAAIALDRLEELHNERFVFEPSSPPSKDDSDVQRILLESLRRIRRLDPTHMGYEPLDGAGLCLLENVRQDELDYNLQRLEDRGWAEGLEGFGGRDEHNYHSRITEAGIQALEELESGESVMTGSPPEERPESDEYFVAHEFSDEQIDDLRRAVDEALVDSDLSPYYADNELRQGHILADKILPKIKECRFGIYDISNPEKPNVFLELGAGLAMEKPCVIICRRGTRVPSDVLGFDRIEYKSYTDLAEQLKGKLKPYLQ